jgi:hypothetical protein
MTAIQQTAAPTSVAPRFGFARCAVVDRYPEFFSGNLRACTIESNQEVKAPSPPRGFRICGLTVSGI